MNRDKLNGYLRQRPFLEGLWLVTMLGVVMAPWLKLLRPRQSVINIVSNTGRQFVFLATDRFCYMIYVGFFRAVD